MAIIPLALALALVGNAGVCGDPVSGFGGEGTDRDGGFVWPTVSTCPPLTVPPQKATKGEHDQHHAAPESVPHNLPGRHLIRDIGGGWAFCSFHFFFRFFFWFLAFFSLCFLLLFCFFFLLLFTLLFFFCLCFVFFFVFFCFFLFFFVFFLFFFCFCFLFFV